MLANFILRIKRADTPFYAALKRLATAILRPEIPVPNFLHPLARGLFSLHAGTLATLRFLRAVFYITPLFRGRCKSSGRRLLVRGMPFIMGNAVIHLGDDVAIEGKIGIFSGHVYAEPLLRIGNRVSIGHLVSLNVSRELVIGDDVMIAGNCTLADSDNHPLDPELRSKGKPPFAQDIKPVHIHNKAWIGEGALIRKGVTIGEGAVVGAGSVVFTDVPPGGIMVGNPAKLVGFSTDQNPPD